MTYVVLFALQRENTNRNYATLISALDALDAALPFYADTEKPVAPLSVCFCSDRSCSELSLDLQEHLYGKDQMMVFQVTDGAARLPAELAVAFRRLFQPPP